tara:strand:+ start:7022 stop:7471 length:450 start_codon:yes stop_codon:yes gene_type:complete
MSEKEFNASKGKKMILKTLLLLGLALTCAIEAQAECPWGESPRVTAGISHVRVDGQKYLVAGQGPRDDFEHLLVECGDAKALDAFDKWRKNRRLVNTLGITAASTGGVSIFVLWPLAIVGAGTGLGSIAPAALAGKARTEFEYALEGNR